MGFRRFRSFILIFIIILSFPVYSQVQIYLNSPPSTGIDISKIVEMTISNILSTLSAAAIAYFGIRRERKKDEKNLKKEWYNKIILDKLIDVVNDYFDSVEGSLKTNKQDRVRKKRLELKRKLDYLKIFDTNLHTKISNLIIDSVDNITNNTSLKEKIRKNNNFKIEVLNLLFKKALNL